MDRIIKFFIPLIVIFSFYGGALWADEAPSFCFDSVSVENVIGDVKGQFDGVIVERFPSLSFEEQYEYFSEGYKERLADGPLDISDAREYVREVQSARNEMHVKGYVVAKIDHRDDVFLNVTYLICWFREGYDGISTLTVTFENVEEGVRVVDLMRW